MSSSSHEATGTPVRRSTSILISGRSGDALKPRADAGRADAKKVGESVDADPERSDTHGGAGRLGSSLPSRGHPGSRGSQRGSLFLSLSSPRLPYTEASMAYGESSEWKARSSIQEVSPSMVVLTF
jgi:hypothetical protein